MPTPPPSPYTSPPTSTTKPAGWVAPDGSSPDAPLTYVPGYWHDWPENQDGGSLPLGDEPPQYPVTMPYPDPPEVPW